MSLGALFSVRLFICQGTLFSLGHSLRGYISPWQVKLTWQLERKQLWSSLSSCCRTKMTGKGVLGALLYHQRCWRENTQACKNACKSWLSHSVSKPEMAPCESPYSVLERLREPHFSLVMCPVLEAPYGGGVLSYSCLPPLNIYFYLRRLLSPSMIHKTPTLKCLLVLGLLVG